MLQIIKDNVLTLFNFLNVMIAVLLFMAGAYSNMLFILIVLLNIVIGVTQEIKAKRMVEKLSILNRPQVLVLRDGEERTVEPEEIVRGDVMILEAGRQICNDAEVLSGSVEVDESLLTGESDPVVKEKGDALYSGSFVVAGRCRAQVVHVGEENYAEKLADEVKKRKATKSLLRDSMRSVTRYTSFLIIPIGVLLFAEAVLLRGNGFADAVVTSAAALLGMLPKGLVLLISVSLAMGVIRLAKNRILVQNIYALETLAHVDVLCLDKTGTITDGSMKVKSVRHCPGVPENLAEMMLSSYLSASEDNNGTIQALRRAFPPEEIYAPAGKIPFSSRRKWGAVSFERVGTVFLGAPERLMKRLPGEVEEEMDKGNRVVAVGYCGEVWQDEERLPDNILPLYVVALSDRIRKDTHKTLDYFRREGVDIKVISGDHLKTVSATAREAGLSGWQDGVDLSALEEEIDYEEICEKYTVFARVTPEQKRQLVQALKKRGHHVAMTGDGVNDLLALREADCSIAISEGSDASRQVAQIVLLDSEFSYLPQVVLEGRRVINNVTRTAGVFFIKTIYSLITSVFCLLCNVPFPFIPIQITLVDAFVEAYPSFVTIFEADMRRPSENFLKRAFGNAFPFALAVTMEIILTSLLNPFSGAQNRTVMYLLLILISIAAVVKSCVPFTGLRTFICVTMILGIFGSLTLLPSLFEVVPLTSFMIAYTAAALAGNAALVLLLEKTPLNEYGLSDKRVEKLS